MAKLDSLNIELAIRYCGNDFEACGIYRKRLLTERLERIRREDGGNPGTSAAEA